MLKKHAILLAPDAAPAAAAPAPAPAATPSPSPAPAAAPTESKSIFEALDDEAADISGKTPEKPKDKPAEKPAEPDKQPDKVPDPKLADKTFQTPKALREAHEKSTREAKELREKVTAYEKQFKDHEPKLAESKKLTERIATLEKELETKVAALRVAKFEVSPEFVKAYDKPFREAAEYVKEVVEGLQVKMPTEEGEEPKFRAAKFDDFTAIYSMPRHLQNQAIRNLFGDDAPQVINHLNELQRLDRNKSRALEEEQKNWETNRKSLEEKEIAQQAQEKEATEAMWLAVNKDIQEKNPDLYQPDPKDKKAAELLTKALTAFDTEMNRGSKTLQERVLLNASIRNRMAAHPVLIHRLKERDAKITELEGVIKAMKDGGTGDTLHPGGEPAKAKELGLLEDLSQSLA